MTEIAQFAIGFAILGFVAYAAHAYTKDRVERALGGHIADLRRATMATRASNERLIAENRRLRACLNKATVFEPELPEWLND